MPPHFDMPVCIFVVSEFLIADSSGRWVLPRYRLVASGPQPRSSPVTVGCLFHTTQRCYRGPSIEVIPSYPYAYLCSGRGFPRQSDAMIERIRL